MHDKENSLDLSLYRSSGIHSFQECKNCLYHRDRFDIRPDMAVFRIEKIMKISKTQKDVLTYLIVGYVLIAFIEFLRASSDILVRRDALRFALLWPYSELSGKYIFGTKKENLPEAYGLNSQVSFGAQPPPLPVK